MQDFKGSVTTIAIVQITETGITANFITGIAEAIV